ncbi:hypothetical protein PCANC_28138, partial [Puccinia coronata f. sp. avenae]
NFALGAGHQGIIHRFENHRFNFESVIFQPMEMLTRLRSSNGNVPSVDVNRSSIFLAHLLTKGSRQEGAHVLAESSGRNQAHACLPRAPVSKTHLSPGAPTSRHTPAHREPRQAGAHLLTRSLGEQGYTFSPRAPESSEQADLLARLVQVPARYQPGISRVSRLNCSLGWYDLHAGLVHTSPASRLTYSPSCYLYQPSEQADLLAELVPVPAQRAGQPPRRAGTCTSPASRSACSPSWYLYQPSK